MAKKGRFYVINRDRLLVRRLLTPIYANRLRLTVPILKVVSIVLLEIIWITFEKIDRCTPKNDVRSRYIYDNKLLEHSANRRCRHHYLANVRTKV